MELTDAIPAPARDDAASRADAPPAAPGTCRRCPLWADATQAVDGRGPAPAGAARCGPTRPRRSTAAARHRPR